MQVGRRQFGETNRGEACRPLVPLPDHRTGASLLTRAVRPAFGFSEVVPNSATDGRSRHPKEGMVATRRKENSPNLAKNHLQLACRCCGAQQHLQAHYRSRGPVVAEVVQRGVPGPSAGERLRPGRAQGCRL